MHRTSRDFSMGTTRELGRVLLNHLLFLPHRHCSFLLRSSGERAGGDAVGDHGFSILFWGGPLSLE